MVPGLVNGLKVPKNLCNPDQIYDADPDVALTLGTYLFCTYGDTSVDFELQKETDEANATVHVEGKYSKRRERASRMEHCS